MPSKLFRPGTTGVDGYVYTTVGSPGATWADLRAYTNVTDIHANYAGAGAKAGLVSTDSSGKWWAIFRGVVVFDVSELGRNIVIDSATLSLYGIGKADDISVSPTINIYTFNKNTGDTIVSPLDYNRIYKYGFNPACDTAITYAGWNASGWNNFSLNTAGRNWIDPTSTATFAIRIANYDVSGTTPAWSVAGTNYASFDWDTGETSEAVAPKLAVYYHTATPSPTAPGTKKIISLEAIRNIEMESMGRARIDKDGYFVYEGRYYRSY